MDMQITIAFIEAAAVFVLTLVMHKDIGAWFGSVGAIVLFGPLFIIATLGILRMLNADPSSVQTIGNSTMLSVTSWFTGNLPGVVISDLAGVVVGAIGGFIVDAFLT